MLNNSTLNIQHPTLICSSRLCGFFLFLHYFDPHFAYIMHDEHNYYPDYDGDLNSGLGISELRNKAESRELSEDDLRFLIAVIKINNDLERIGDQAVNIAERVGVTAKSEQTDFYFDYSAMGEKVQVMLKMSLDALINMDDDVAWKVVNLDEEVDRFRVAYGICTDRFL